VKAILQALLFCKEFHLHHVIIESDCSIAVGWVSSNLNRPWKLRDDLSTIDRLREEVDCINVNHIYREANMLADYFAKSGCNRIRNIWSYRG
jgi:ribonuclease HI